MSLFLSWKLLAWMKSKCLTAVVCKVCIQLSPGHCFWAERGEVGRGKQLLALSSFSKRGDAVRGLSMGVHHRCCLLPGVLPVSDPDPKSVASRRLQGTW